MLSSRVASAAVLLPIVALAAYVGGPWWGALVVVAVCLAMWELLHLIKAHGVSVSVIPTIILAVLLAADGSWPQLGLLQPALLFLAIVPLSIEVFHRNRPGSLESWGLSVAAALYLGYAASHFGRLRSVPNGLAWLATAMIGTWIADTAAYVVGVRYGKRRLAPHISPKKSWEGALGELGGALVVALVAGPLWLGLGVGSSLLLGALIAVAATLGDLGESVIKRQVGVKDSGSLIPGHGGMLDRIDSLLFVVPLVYWYQILLNWLQLLP